MFETLRQAWQIRRAKLRRTWRIIQANLRLDLAAVCEMSQGKGLVDYHDYPDDPYGSPYHFTVLTCKRCGKHFTI